MNNITESLQNMSVLDPSQDGSRQIMEVARLDECGFSLNNDGSASLTVPAHFIEPDQKVSRISPGQLCDIARTSLQSANKAVSQWREKHPAPSTGQVDTMGGVGEPDWLSDVNDCVRSTMREVVGSFKPDYRPESSGRDPHAKLDESVPDQPGTSIAPSKKILPRISLSSILSEGVTDVLFEVLDKSMVFKPLNIDPKTQDCEGSFRMESNQVKEFSEKPTYSWTSQGRLESVSWKPTAKLASGDSCSLKTPKQGILVRELRHALQEPSKGGLSTHLSALLQEGGSTDTAAQETFGEALRYRASTVASDEGWNISHTQEIGAPTVTWAGFGSVYGLGELSDSDEPGSDSEWEVVKK